MPIFEFSCSACGRGLEVIVLPGEQTPDRCPDCRGELRRRWSRVGVQYMGWGFASTDKLVGDDRPRKPFRKLRDKAAELFD